MEKTTHQLLKALLMSKDLGTGLIAYDILMNKITPEQVLFLIRTENINDLDVDQKKALAHIRKNIDIHLFDAVLSGNVNKSFELANDNNKVAISRMTALQMLQSLLACEDELTKREAYNILSGMDNFGSVLSESNSEFLKCVLRGNYKAACEVANDSQLKALNIKETERPTLQFTLNTYENLHRLNYIMLDQQLTLDEVINSMLKSFYEVIRVDDHAELMSDELPQNYII